MDTNYLIKQALIEIKRLKKEKDIPIAIIGMDCRFPNGINTPEEFWEALIAKKDCITEIPKERWNIDEYYSSNHAEHGKMYVKKGGFIENIDKFDLDLFKISDREAKYLDPQQRIFMEVVWNCLERSGINPLGLRGTKTGVYLGICTHDYALHSLYSQQMDKIDIYSFTGSAFSMASGRLSYMLGLEGTSISIDTACSSSLVALHEACNSLRNAQSEMAIVGGVNLIITPEHTIQFCKVNALSPTSKVKAFDASADGYVRSEGCGVVLLKRLDKAIEDNNQILAVIRGSAVNNDGASSSLTAPNGVVQQKLIQEALRNSKIEPREVSYVEAHGTGTPLGDPIEINALSKVYCQNRSNPLWVGAVKTNIGHLEAAAGMASLIKAILAIKNKAIPPNIHFNNPNPEFDWENSNVKIPTEVESWPKGKKIAGISAFGFSGTNAHIIIEEAPSVEENSEVSNFPILALSGQNEKALIRKIRDTYEFINRNSKIALDKICYTANVCRPHLQYRKSFVFNDIYDLKRLMSDYLEQSDIHLNCNSKVVFYIPDDPNITDGDIRVLFNSNKGFRDVFINRIDELDIENIEDFFAKTTKQTRDFITLYTLASVLIHSGIEFESILSNGKGWFAAFCLSEMLSLKQSLELLNCYIENAVSDIFISKLQNMTFSKPVYLLKTEEEMEVDLLEIQKRDFWINNYSDLSALKQIYCVIYIGSNSNVKSTENFICCCKQEDGLAFYKVIAYFYEIGINIKWSIFFEKNQYLPVMIPTTQLTGNRFWIDRPKQQIKRDIMISEHMFFRYKLPIFEKKSQCYLFHITPQRNLFVKDHGFLGQVILPATAYTEMMNYVGKDLFGEFNFSIKNISYEKALVIQDQEKIELHIYAQKSADNKIQLSIVSPRASVNFSNTDWLQHVSATIVEKKHPLDEKLVPEYIYYNNSKFIEVKSFYEHLNNMGYIFKQLHQGISELSISGNFAWAKVVLPSKLSSELQQCSYHPALLDACSQVFLTFIQTKLSDDVIYITIGTDEFIPLQNIEEELYVNAQVTDENTNSVRGNIYIYNNRHEKVAAILGYTTKKVEKSSISFDINRYENTYYNITWTKKEAKYLPGNAYNGSYIIWADRSKFSEALQEEFFSRGIQCIVVRRNKEFHKLGKFEFELDVTNTEQCSLLKDSIKNVSTDISGSVYLWNLDYSFSPLCEDIKSKVKEIIKPLLSVVQQFYGSDAITKRLTFSTQNLNDIKKVGDYWTNPLSMIVRGFMKVMNLEYPNVQCRGIDINEKVFPSSKVIVNEIINESEEKMIAFREDQRYVPQLTKMSLQKLKQNNNQSVFQDDYALGLKEKGSITHLNYEKVVRIEPAEDEVEIEVMVAGFNFHDIIHVLNLMNSEADGYGLDCVGRITKVGKKVHGLQKGDLVIAFAPGCFAKYVTVNSLFVVRKPKNINIYQSATIPSAYLTAYSITNDILPLKAGSSILIHAGSGGLGVALINLAQRLGLTVYATASKSKWFLLEQLGVKYIFDSRTTEYAKQILDLTNNEGVDAVVNSFTGDYITKNFSILKSGGYFVELGEREKLTKEQVLKYRNDISYHTFSLFDVVKLRPQKIKEMLEQLCNYLANESIRPIPYQVFDKTDIKEAFRLVQKGRHIGKVLIRFSEDKKNIKDKKTVVVTGGASGIGWEIVKYWAKNHNDSLVILGRSHETEEITYKLNSLREKGKEITYYFVDVGDLQGLSKVFDDISKNHPMLKGIIHSAGISIDKLIMQENWDNIEKVTNPKILGAWNLHSLSIGKELEFFILFSSVTAVIGSIGVLSYGLGNSFMNGLQQYRKQLGLPCLCINWGPWQEVGMLTRLGAVGKEIWTQNGYEALSTKDGIEIFKSLKEINGSVSVMPLDWDKWMRQYVNGRVPDLLQGFWTNYSDKYSNEQKQTVAHETFTLDNKAENSDKVYDDIEKILKGVIQKDISEEVLEKSSFQELGIDSLMSVEFRNLLNERFKTNFPISLLYSYPDVRALHKYICEEVLKISTINNKTAVGEEVNEPEEKVQNDIQSKDEHLSIDDLRKVLDEKIDSYLT